MKFFNTLRRALGFDYQEEEDIESDDTSEAPQSTEQPETAVEGLTELSAMPVIDPDVKARIFDGVLDVFNSSLPDFLNRSVDKAAQRRLLLEALDKSTDDYLSGLMVEAEQYAEAKLRASTDASRREAERLKTQMQQVEQQRQNIQEQQLSADRRRRALANRVGDLEKQVETLEAEREQYQLENKSLLNKLKVADLQPELIDQLSQEVEQLRAQLNGKAPETEAASADTSLTEALKTELDDLRAQLLQAQQDKEAAQAETSTLRSAVENLKEQQTMGQAMYNDMQQKYAQERERADGLEHELEESNKVIERVAKVQQQLEQVEQIIAKRDERIDRLKSTNRRLKDENARLKESISNGAYGGLFDIEDSANEPEVKHTVDPQMAALEDDFECPDWFVSEPGPGEVSPLMKHTDDFGYIEPPKKPKRPDNDAQLSLF